MNIDGKLATQEVFKNQTGNFEYHSGTQPLNGFCQPPLDIPSSILKTVKRSLNMFADAAQHSVNIAELLKQTIFPFAESNSNHQFSLEGVEDSAPTLVVDPFRLGQVFKNLLSNAVKYSPKGGKITVRCRVGADEVEIGIQDEGLGMTPKQQAHLFEKFYRADASNTAIVGTGLGLTISQLIVELHHGKIWAESKYGVGTTFYVSLPLRAPAPTANEMAGEQ